MFYCCDMTPMFPCSPFILATLSFIQPTNILKARWPEVGVVNRTLIREAEYLNEVVHEFRVRIKKMMEIRGKVSCEEGVSINGNCLLFVPQTLEQDSV